MRVQGNVEGGASESVKDEDDAKPSEQEVQLEDEDIQQQNKRKKKNMVNSNMYTPHPFV